MKFELNETEHQMLRNILNEWMRQESVSMEDDMTLISLHEKIVLYWMDEPEGKEKLEDQARFWGEALKAGLYGGTD